MEEILSIAQTPVFRLSQTQTPLHRRLAKQHRGTESAQGRESGNSCHSPWHRYHVPGVPGESGIKAAPRL
jgi:hypothetical protein